MVDPLRPWGAWCRPGRPGSQSRETPYGSPSGSPSGSLGTGEPCPRGSTEPRPPPPGPVPGRGTPREAAVNGRAASSGEGRAGPTGARVPTPGKPHEETGRTPGAQGGTAGASTQHRLEDLYDPQDPDTTLLFYMEGDLEPRPDPDRHTAIFMATPLCEEILKRVVPRSRWPQGDGYVERF